MALPIVPGSEVSTPTSAVKMDSSAFREAALAPGKVAQAIGHNVGGLFEDVSRNVQANQNAREVFDADLAMRKTKDNFTASLASRPDEGTWLPAYKEQVDQLRQQTLESPRVGPDVRRVLEQKFDVWEAATTSEIRTAAMLKGAKETRESAIADSTYAAHQGDIEGAMNTLNAAVAHHAMTPGDVKKVSARFPSIAAQAQADSAISTNPIKAPELIKRFKGTIEPAVYLGIEERARSARNAAQSQNLNGLAEDMDNSPDGTIDPKLLSEKVKMGEITQRAANGLTARMKREHLATARDDHSLLMMQADDHDWVDDKDPEAAAHQMKEDGASLPPALRKSLYAHIDSKMKVAKKAGLNEEKPVVRDIMERGKQDFARGLFRPATEADIVEMVPGTHFWNSATKKVVGTETKSRIPDSQWELQADDHERATTMLNYAKWQDKMRGFFKTNPQATSEEAQTYSQQLMAPHVEGQVKAALGAAAAPPNVSQASYEKLKKGDLFWWNGKQVAKK